MSEWINAAGIPQQTSMSNLAHEDQRNTAQSVVGGANLEARTNADGSTAIVDQGAAEYAAGKDPVDHGGSVIATAKTEGGGIIVNRTVRGTDQVTLPEGFATTAEVAAQLGYLVRNADGTYSDAQRPQTLKNPAEVAQKDAPRGFSIGDDGEAAMASIIANVMPSDTVKALEEIVQLGEVSENTLARMASMAQIEPDQMADQINTAHQAFYEAATDHMASLGVTNEEAFAAFMQENPNEATKMVEGARALAMSNDTTGLDDVAGVFLEHADRYMIDEVKAALDEVQFPYHMRGDGRLIVEIDGAQVPWQVAVRQKMLRFL